MFSLYVAQLNRCLPHVQYATSLAGYNLFHPRRNQHHDRVENHFEQIEKFYFSDNADVEFQAIGVRAIISIFQKEEFAPLNASLASKLCTFAEDHFQDIPYEAFSMVSKILQSSGNPNRILQWALKEMTKAPTVDQSAQFGQLILANVRRIHDDPFMSARDVYKEIDIDGSFYEDELGRIDASLHLGRLWSEDYMGRNIERRDEALKNLLSLQSPYEEYAFLIPGMTQAIFRGLTSELVPFNNVRDAILLIAYQPTMEILSFLLSGVVNSKLSDEEKQACIDAVPICLNCIADAECIPEKERPSFFRHILLCMESIETGKHREITRTLARAHPGSSFFPAG